MANQVAQLHQEHDLQISKMRETANKFEKELYEFKIHDNLVDTILNDNMDIGTETNNEIKKIDNDIYALRRQIEINQDSSLKKDDIIFVLKSTFLYLALIFLVMYFAKDYPQLNKIIIIIISIIYVYIVGKTLYSFLIRDNMRWTVYDWGGISIFPNGEEEQLASTRKEEKKEVKCSNRRAIEMEKEKEKLKSKYKNIKDKIYELEKTKLAVGRKKEEIIKEDSQRKSETEIKAERSARRKQIKQNVRSNVANVLQKY